MNTIALTILAAAPAPAAPTGLGGSVGDIPGVNTALIVGILFVLLGLAGMLLAVKVGFRAGKGSDVKGAANSAATYGIAIGIAVLSISVAVIAAFVSGLLNSLI